MFCLFLHLEIQTCLLQVNFDAEAEKFVAEADLTQFDLSEFKPMRFEIDPKAGALHMRIPVGLLEAVKAKAKAKGIPYTRYVRFLLGNDDQATCKHRTLVHFTSQPFRFAEPCRPW